MRQTGPSGRPSRGQSSRDVQGVRIRPTKTSPASVGGGGSTATSLARTSFSLTMPAPPLHPASPRRSVDRDPHVRGLHPRIGLLPHRPLQIGRPPCRERGSPYV